MQSQSHGGQREGAGRPPKPDALIRRTVYLEQRHIDLIAWHQSQTNITFSHALRAVLDHFERIT